MLGMNKLVPFMLLFFFISGSFVSSFSSVSASELIEDSWNTKTPMSQARFGLGVVAVGGKIYAIGGAVDAGRSFVGTNECYDPVSDTWTTLKSMPTPRARFAIAAYQGKIYCIGGETGAGKPSTFGVNEVYNPTTNSWSTKASVPFNGECLLVNIEDGKFFVITEQNLFMYNVATDSWTEKTRIPDEQDSSRLGAGTSAAVGNKIIFFYSYIIDSSLSFRNKVMIYDTKSDAWSKGADPPHIGTNPPPYTRSFYGGAVGVTTGQFAPQKVYVIHYTHNLVYTPAKDTWSTAKDMPTERRGFGVAVVDDLLYVIGGYTPHHQPAHSDFLESTEVVEQYVPIDYRNTTYTTTTPPHSNAVTTSKPEPSKPSSTQLIIATLVILVGVTGGLVLYLKNSKRKIHTISQF
jgi:N-acetylneuraminic acid mutarotase